MIVRATSIAAFRSTDRAKQRSLVLDVMRTRPDWTCFEVAEVMGVPDHWVSGRITELKGMKKVEMAGYCRTNPISKKSCNVVKVK